MDAPDRIHDWQTYFGVIDSSIGRPRTLEEHAERNPNGQLDRRPPAAGLHKQKKTRARVSGGCWIADCPDPSCGGAEFVNFDDLRFFCCGCRNRATGGKPLPVIPPEPSVRLEVENVLVKRPDPSTRNWTEGEEVADLKAENLLHGFAP